MLLDLFKQPNRIFELSKMLVEKDDAAIFEEQREVVPIAKYLNYVTMEMEMKD